MLQIKHAWEEFCEELGITKRLRDPAIEKIIAQYSTPPRAYHNLAHVVFGLPYLHKIRPLLRYPNELFFSWVHHDVIYVPGAEDNEIKSAEFADAMGAEISLSNPFRYRSNRLLMLSQRHIPPEDIEGKAQIDLDLLIFGQDEATFDWYDQGIWLEYKHLVSEEMYCLKRAQVLEEFFRRSPLYSIPAFEKEFGVKAKENLRRAIDRLRQEIILK